MASHPRRMQDMWVLRFDVLPGERGMRGVLECAGASSSFEQALWGLREDPGCGTALSTALADLPYRAFTWETPPVTRSTLGRPFECVVLDRPSLARPADVAAFADRFVDDALVVEFENLGRDAILIAPCARASLSAYGHLAAFVRNAPIAQQHALWTRVGEAMDRRVDARPVWLSTAGGGVAWLHVRLDDRPKYYGHAPYRARP